MKVNAVVSNGEVSMRTQTGNSTDIIGMCRVRISAGIRLSSLRFLMLSHGNAGTGTETNYRSRSRWYEICTKMKLPLISFCEVIVIFHCPNPINFRFAQYSTRLYILLRGIQIKLSNELNKT